jgi:hypothetical protein
MANPYVSRGIQRQAWIVTAVHAIRHATLGTSRVHEGESDVPAAT